MKLAVTVGPPGSGRTERMLAAARAACDAGKRVWWVGLPAQRAHVLHRLTANGYAALGFEFMSAQQLYYRLLTQATAILPLVVGSARLVRVVEALHAVGHALPTPGEARLFAAAIAEAKRFAVDAEAYERLAVDGEQRRFAAVYRAYQAGMRGVWDYDDARSAAVDLVGREQCAVGADLVIVDGLREVGPLELRFLRGLAKHVAVRLTLPALPPGLEADEELPARSGAVVERYVAPNPVTEARWVMSSLKRDLFEGGFRPLDLAVIAPPERARALTVLAEEYGVPLMDESPLALADAGPGRALVDLLELPELPTASRLLAVPDLVPLGRLVLEAGVAGNDAVTELARLHELDGVWRRWRGRLEVGSDPVAWARGLIEEAVPGAAPTFAANALAKAQEAARLGSGPGFRAWWAALLRDAREARREPAGVALLDATLASGRRYRKAYLLGAVEGAYGAGEREDYFLPEERRSELSDSFERLGLPRRFQGRGPEVAAELLQRADRLVITAPHGDQGGRFVPDAALMGVGVPAGLPAVPVGSPVELGAGARFTADLSAVALGEPYVESLRRYRECSFRYWGETLVRVEQPPDAARALRAALVRSGPEPLTPERIADLAVDHPAYAGWLGRHAERLARLKYGVTLGGRRGYALARLDATERQELQDGGRNVTIYRFVAWGDAWDAGSAEQAMRDRWTEYWAVGALFAQPSFQVSEAHIVLWPIGGEPIDLAPRGVRPEWRRVVDRRRLVEETLPAFERGEVRPSPGFVCRTCPVFDLCREGVR
ncbi:MAG: hypothetical protein KIT12_04525 [Trueperaceae bacterium]|nr:hypothetical protein [Trueperaceae bacterium]